MPVLSGRSGRIAQALASVAAGGLLLAACSSGGSGTANTTGTQTAAAQAGGGGATSSAVMVQVHSGPMGSYLTDAAGNSLYVFAADTSSSSTCYDACASYWPPLTTAGTPQAGSGAQSGLLGTTKRTDGTTQVTYSGHPLYYYKGDSKPGDTAGQGINELGGLWWLVAPSGSAITAAPSSGSTAATSGSEWS